MNTQFHYHTGQNEDAIALVETYHYSKRCPRNIVFTGSIHLDGGLFGDHGECVAATVFCPAPGGWSEQVLELSRLIKKPLVEFPLTSLIKKACDSLRKKGFDLLVSFADWTQNHHGGIYQASSWNFARKKLASRDGLFINGQYKPCRSCNQTYGTSSPTKLKELLKADIEPHFDEGKFLYWKALNRKGEEKAKRLGLEKNKYPKPDLELVDK